MPLFLERFFYFQKEVIQDMIEQSRSGLGQLTQEHIKRLRRERNRLKRQVTIVFDTQDEWDRFRRHADSAYGGIHGDNFSPAPLPRSIGVSPEVLEKTHGQFGMRPATSEEIQQHLISIRRVKIT